MNDSGNRTCASAEDIFAASEQPVRAQVPFGPDKYVWVYCLTLGERNEFNKRRRDTAKAADDEQSTELFREMVIAWCTRNDQGTPLFDRDAKDGDLRRLSKQYGALLEPVIEAAIRINGWDRKEERPFGGTSTTTPTSSSSTSSPPTSASSTPPSLGG